MFSVHVAAYFAAGIHEGHNRGKRFVSENDRLVWENGFVPPEDIHGEGTEADG